MKIITKIKGQVLILAIVMILGLFLLVLTAAEVGNLVYQKVHLQNAADSAALEGGIWYARTLNIASISNKVLAGTIVLACFTGNLGGVKAAQRVQDIIVESAPYIAAAMVVKNGAKNDCISVPIFNGNPVPVFNIQRRTVTDVMENEDGFSYTKAGTNETVFVKKENVRFDPKIGKNGGYIFQSDDGKITRFVKKGISSEVEVPLDLVETSKTHTCLVMTYKTGFKRLFPGILKNKNGKTIKPLLLSAFSMTKISGGSLDISEISGASYDVIMVRPAVPDIPDNFDPIKYSENYGKDRI